MKKNLLTVFFTLLVSLVSITAQSQACGGVCSGFRTQTQGGWGATPNGGNPGVYLHNNFAAAFPSGLTIGSGTKTVKFTTAQSITDNLPAGGGPTTLPSGNAVDPASGYLNTELDGQIIAAMLSVGFDANDASFSISSGVLGNLVFNSGTFNGKSVQFVIDEANKAIGSVGSSYSLTDINTALTSFNENYDNGTAGSGNGNLNCPGALPVVADITGTASVCVGSTTTLADATPSGTWSTNAGSIATVSAGVVTGVAAGTATISYSVNNACGTTSKTLLVTVYAVPTAPTVGITAPTCANANGSVAITSSTTGLTFSTDGTNYAAYVTPFTVAAGASYSITAKNAGGCVSTITSGTMATQPLGPVVADIIGTATICKDSTSTLTDATIGGVWSSDNNAVATVNATGTVTPVIEGTVNISYTVTNGCGTSFKSVLVTIQDCSGVGSGGGGGLESKSLGDAVGNRIFNKAVNSLQGPVDYSTMSIVNQSSNRTLGVGTAITLSEILPKQISGSNYKAFTTTPTDIPSITNAKDVLSIDYTFNNQAKAVAFGTKTSGEVYDHTKAICDRLKGSQLMNIEKVVVNGINLVRFDLKNPKGQMEYTFSFAIGAKTGRSNYTIQSNWLNKDYTADEVMYNIQLWAELPSTIESMASDIITRLNGSMPVNQVLSNQKLPKTFITSGKRESSNIALQITNTTAGTNGYFEVLEKSNEQSGTIVTKQIPFTVPTSGKATVNVPASDTYESTINMYLNGVLQDQVFMSDGNWATAVNNANSTIKSFTVSNDAKRIVDNKDDFLLFRNVQVEANTSDFVSVYKILRGGGAAQDLSGFKSLAFTAAASGASMNIILVKEGITNWSDQYSLAVPLTGDKKEYRLNLNDFVSGTSNTKINPNDITTVIFALASSTGKMSTVTADISNVSFSKTDFAYLQSLNSLEVNAFPNPSKGRFNATFKSPKAQSVVLTVRDANTGVSIFTQNVQAQVGDNTVPVNVQHQGNMSSYILSVEGQGVRYTPKKMIIE